MVSPRFLPLALMGIAVQGQDLWDPISQAVIALRHPESYILVTSAPLDRKWYGETALGATNFKDLILMAPDRTVADAIKRIHGGEGWVLFNPSGERIADGRGLPKPSEIQERMQQAGWVPYREVLGAYLRKNPEDGQAWLELAYDIARQARDAKATETLSATLTKTMREGLVPCLQTMANTPSMVEAWGDPGRTLVMSLFLAMSQSELDRDPDIADAIRPLAASLREFISRNPELERLWYAHGLTLRATGWDGNTDATIRFAFSFDGVPGRPWPPPFYAFWMRSWYRMDPETMANEGSAILAKNLEPDMVRRLGKPHVDRSLQAWGALHLEGLLLQNRVDEALSYLGWLRSQSGSDWSRLAALLRGNLAPTAEDSQGSFDPKPMPPLTAEQQASLRLALAESPLPDEPLPRFVPMRLAMVGSHKPIEWSLLQNNPIFTPWGPTELVWQPLKPDESHALISRHAWNEEPRWVLLKGGELLASGAGRPTVERLDAGLRAHATPSLEILSTFIKAHPDRLDARRERMERIRPRLPNPHLEPFFLEDSEACASPIGSLPLAPDPALWRPAAKRVCTRLAGKLRHWPFNTGDWRAYAEWSALDATSQRPATLLADLETWPRQAFTPLPGPIPMAASLSVMTSLLDSGRTSEADAWAQVIWERGCKAWLSTWAKLPSPSASDQAKGRYDQPFPEVTGFLAKWGTALTRRGNRKRLTALRDELDAIRPGLANKLIGAGGD